MRRKSGKVSRLRLSPNEEAQLVREELDRRRKLRLQQVREQERFIAQHLRRAVTERRATQLQILADTLKQDWQQQRFDRLQTLTKTYEQNLGVVGYAHRSAQENEPDLEALAQKSLERQERAADRHQEALRELTARRHEEEQQRGRHIETRRKTLLKEKKRALRMASLPLPPPNPLEFIEMKTRPPLKAASAEHFSLTHCHMPETSVEKETDTQQQMDARQAAKVEVHRLEELKQVEARDRQENMEKARLRGKHALWKEQHTQDRAQLLTELERLQQADWMRRRQMVNSVPGQIFQPLYRQEEIREEQQRDLEIAFQDMYTEEGKVRGDMGLQLVPEPLPHPSSASHDEDLDVTLDPEGTPEGEERVSSETITSSVPSRDPGRQALRRLLDRIRNHKDQEQLTSSVAVTSPEADVVTDTLSIETGSLSSLERVQAGSVKQTPSLTQNEIPEVSDEPILAGTMVISEEQARVMATFAERERRAHVQTDEGVLVRQQREQLLLLEELEEKRSELEQLLKEAQQERCQLEEAAQRHSGIEVMSGDVHTHRLHQYQQRLLEQNRLHKKCVEDARCQLEDYQHTLKLRHAIGSTTAAQMLHPSSVCPVPSSSSRTPEQSSALTLTLSPHPAITISPEDQLQREACQMLSAQSQVYLWCSGNNHSLEAGVQDQSRACVSEREQLPLPPLSVVLELLRSRQHHAVCATTQQAEVRGSAALSSDPDSTVQTSTLPETEREQPSVEADRWERQSEDLFRSDSQGEVMPFSGLQTHPFPVKNALLRAIEESCGHARCPAEPCQSSTTTALPPPLDVPPPSSADCVYDLVPVNRGRVRPPVSRAHARLAFLQHMEQHELSAIQEVETPVNISLDADLSKSSSVSLSAVISEGSHSLSEKSQVTGRTSRMSWRETLLIESSASQRSASSINQQPKSSVDPDCLSSTTISTASFSTSAHEPDNTSTEASTLRIEPVEVKSSAFVQSPKSTSCHVTGNQSQTMRDSIQQIIDKYTKDLDASLRTDRVLTDLSAGNTSCVSKSWSSVLQQDVSHENMTPNSAVDLSSADLTGVFLPLQPHPDIESSSSSSSSRTLVRNNQRSRTQGWSETISRIVDCFSDRLSLRLSDHKQGSTNTQRILCKDQEQASHLIGCFTNDSLQTSSVQSVRQNSIGLQSSVSQTFNSISCQVKESTAEQLPDQLLSCGQFEGCDSVLISRASDMSSSQVLDDSSVPAEGLREMTLQQTRRPEARRIVFSACSLSSSAEGADASQSINSDTVRLSTSEIITPPPQHSEGDGNTLTETPHGDTSDCFVALSTEVTHNESLECSAAARIPLDAEMCGLSTCNPDSSAGDWLEPADTSLPSLSFARLRADTRIQTDLQISVEQLSLTYESLSEADIVAPPNAADVSRMQCSPSEVCLQEKGQKLLSHKVPSKAHSLCTEVPQHQSTDEENMLAKFLESAQEEGHVKGILEESTISFISLPESTLQSDVTRAEERTDRPAEAETGHNPQKESEPQEECDHCKGRLSSCPVEGSSQSECPEAFLPHAVMLVKFQSSSAQQQEVLLRQQHLAQQSAGRAAKFKAKRAESGKMTRVLQNVSKLASSPGSTDQKLEMVCRLKTVGEVKICTAEQRCLEEAEIYQRTRRLYSQLEEVKQRKELYSRQKTYAKNREKAKEFQRKTLEKLRAKQKR